jgi:uncharacterized protein (DUF2235 family)
VKAAFASPVGWPPPVEPPLAQYVTLDVLEMMRGVVRSMSAQQQTAQAEHARQAQLPLQAQLLAEGEAERHRGEVAAAAERERQAEARLRRRRDGGGGGPMRGKPAVLRPALPAALCVGLLPLLRPRRNGALIMRSNRRAARTRITR